MLLFFGFSFSILVGDSPRFCVKKCTTVTLVIFLFKNYFSWYTFENNFYRIFGWVKFPLDQSLNVSQIHKVEQERNFLMSLTQSLIRACCSMT